MDEQRAVDRCVFAIYVDGRYCLRNRLSSNSILLKMNFQAITKNSFAKGILRLLGLTIDAMVDRHSAKSKRIPWITHCAFLIDQRTLFTAKDLEKLWPDCSEDQLHKPLSAARALGNRYHSPLNNSAFIASNCTNLYRRRISPRINDEAFATRLVNKLSLHRDR